VAAPQQDSEALLRTHLTHVAREAANAGDMLLIFRFSCATLDSSHTGLVALYRAVLIN
jgi:hypothetical protein